MTWDDEHNAKTWLALTMAVSDEVPSGYVKIAIENDNL